MQTSRNLCATLLISKRITKIASQCLRHSTYSDKSHHCGALRGEDAGSKVKLAGWLQYQRMGYFLTLRDGQGTTQVTVNDEKLQQLVTTLPAESVIEVEGTVQHRPEDQQNKKMATGDIEVVASNVKVLNTCQQEMPFAIHDFHKVKEWLRLEYRYLDLRNTSMQRNLRLRSNVINKMRDFLCNKHGFVDVETPTLFRKTPGGAREFPVATHNEGEFYTLPQSPQQFKQLLMVGAIDRYMQVARCYRDETAKPDRQPEFTQLDIELSFTTKEGVQQLIEELLAYSWPSDISPLPSSPFPRLTYNEAMQRYGVDKPDTRFGMEIQDVSDSFSTCSAPGVIKALEGHQCSKVKAINFKHAGKQLSRKNVEELKQLIKDLHLSHVWHAFIKIDEDGGWQGSLDASLDEQHVHNINQQLSLQAGDLMILAAGSETEALPLLGRMRLQVANMLEDKGEDVREKDKMAFLWVVDFPMFLPKEDNSDGIESTHHPFTAPHPEDMSLVFSDPENARSQHYDLVLNGTEIGGGSIRMHNAKLQRYVLNNLLKEDTSSLEHLLTGLEYGCPPHGGIALGLDRLMSILCNASSVRDVIAFPKSGDGKDLMAKAPAQLSDADRQYYHLKGKQHQQ